MHPPEALLEAGLQVTHPLDHLAGDIRVDVGSLSADLVV